MLKVHSIFLSIDGEVNKWGQGRLTTFVRLAGCEHQCVYCDTKDAWTGGDDRPIQLVVEQIHQLGCPKITITGGEPLLQASAVYHLILGLSSRFGVSFPFMWPEFTIETSGYYDPFLIIPKSDAIAFVVDYKLPGAQIKNPPKRDLTEVYQRLRPIDWIKFVIMDETDYNIARDLVKIDPLFGTNPARIAFGIAVGGELTHKQLVEKMIKDRLWNVSLNCQLHKLIDLP